MEDEGELLRGRDGRGVATEDDVEVRHDAADALLFFGFDLVGCLLADPLAALVLGLVGRGRGLSGLCGVLRLLVPAEGAGGRVGEIDA